MMKATQKLEDNFNFEFSTRIIFSNNKNVCKSNIMF